MQPKFNAPQGGYDSELLCPKCGGNYLRHDKVEVFERGEDQATAVHVTVEDGKAVLDQSLAGIRVLDATVCLSTSGAKVAQQEQPYRYINTKATLLWISSSQKKSNHSLQQTAFCGHRTYTLGKRKG